MFGGQRSHLPFDGRDCEPSFKQRVPAGWASSASWKRWKINMIGATDDAGVKRLIRTD